MSYARLMLALALLASCSGGESDVFPSAPPAKLKAPSAHVSPPPPPPTDPEGKGPAPVPPQIAAFLRGATDVEVVLSRDDDGRRAESQVLPRDLAAQTVAVLISPTSYTENHPLCTDQGIRLQLRRDGKEQELSIGLTCRHVHDGATGEEIGILSSSGHAFFIRLGERVHAP